MKYRIIITLIISAIYLTASADDSNGFKIKGSVRDRLTNSYVMEAQVECIDANDSVVGKGIAIDFEYDRRRQAMVEKATFNIDIPRLKGNYTLRFTHEEYDTITAPLNLTDIGAREYDRDLGVYYMDRPKVNMLQEVEVTASKVMFYNRGDTIVYNASAFQLAEGSMLDELIEQLPGVELREGGKIYVNGKFVESLLLNGKDFFKGDNQLMLDNLAAYTVDKIEVYKKQTDRARFLGLDTEANKEYVMDVKLKKEYIGGWIINAEMAGGTEERRLARLFAMNYSALSQFTFIGNSNNLNDNSRPTAEDEWDPTKMSDGERRHNETGIDYSVENDDASRKASGNIVFKNDKIDSQIASNSTIFLPGQNTFENSRFGFLYDNYTLSTDHTLYWQTSGVALQLNPQLSLSKANTDSESESETWYDDQHSKLINRTLSQSFDKSKTMSTGISVNATIKVPKTSDAIDIYGSVRYSASKSDSESADIINYGDQAIPTDARHSRTDDSPTHDTYYNIGARYNLVLNNRFSGELEYTFSGYDKILTSKYYLGRLLAEQTGDYTLENLFKIKTELDATNSNTSDEYNVTNAITGRLTYKPVKGLELSVRDTYNMIDSKLRFRQNNELYPAEFNHNFNAFTASASYYKSYEDERNRSLSVSYSYDAQMPTLQNLITIPNTRDPLSLTLGNPDLKPTTSNQANIFAQLNSRHNLMIYGFANLNLMSNAISIMRLFDTNTGKGTYQPINVEGNWTLSSYIAAAWYWKKQRCNFELDFNYLHSHSNSMTGTSYDDIQQVTMSVNRFSPQLTVSKHFGGKNSRYISLEIEPVIQHNRSTDVNATNISPTDGRYKLSGKFELPKGWALSTSMLLRTRHGYNDDNIKRQEWIWNARVSKSFMKGRLLTSVIAYDLLHQHQSYDYYVSPQMRAERFTNTIPRYILVDIQYKINIQPKKKISQNTHYF